MRGILDSGEAISDLPGVSRHDETGENQGRTFPKVTVIGFTISGLLHLAGPHLGSRLQCSGCLGGASLSFLHSILLLPDS